MTATSPATRHLVRRLDPAAMTTAGGMVRRLSDSVTAVVIGAWAIVWFGTGLLLQACDRLVPTRTQTGPLGD